MEAVIQKYFNIDQIPNYIIEEFEIISDRFNPCSRECLDGKFIIEFHTFNENRLKQMKSKVQKSRDITKLISQSIKYLSEQNYQMVRDTLIEAVENSKNLSFDLNNSKRTETKTADRILSEMKSQKRKFLVKFKRPDDSQMIWKEDTSKRESLNLSPKVNLSGKRCVHGSRCAWLGLWKLLCGDFEMPCEFCKDLGNVSCSRNFIENE